MKKIIFIVSFILIILFIEGILRIQHGTFPYETESHQFKHNYLDIHKRFYKKVQMYVAQRQYYEDYDAFQVVKGRNAIRVFVIGGSVAYDWKNKIDIPDNLIPDKNLEIINCGIPGYDSYRVSLIGEEILSYQPDLIIVLSGNNEYFFKQGFNAKHII